MINQPGDASVLAPGSLRHLKRPWKLTLNLRTVDQHVLKVSPCQRSSRRDDLQDVQQHLGMFTTKTPLTRGNVLLRFDDEGAELRDPVARHLTDARSPRSMRREKTKLQCWRRPTVPMLRARVRSGSSKKSTVWVNLRRGGDPPRHITVERGMDSTQKRATTDFCAQASHVPDRSHDQS